MRRAASSSSAHARKNGAGANRLAAMGLRTVVDMVALELVGDAGGFGKKLDALVGDGYVAGNSSRT